MASTKTFTIAGISTVQGHTRLRFANDILRAKVLATHGHTDIWLTEFETPMTKSQIVDYLQGSDPSTRSTAIAKIVAWINDRDARSRPLTEE